MTGGLPLHVTSPLAVEAAAEAERLRAAEPELFPWAWDLSAKTGLPLRLAVLHLQNVRAAFLRIQPIVKRLFDALEPLVQEQHRRNVRRVHRQYRQRQGRRR